MSYELTVKLKPGYVHASVTGENSRENVLGYMNDIRNACRRLGCGTVLIEEHLRGPSLGVLDIFSMVTGGIEETGRTLRCMAYVDTNPEHDAGKMRFAETVAVNRGVRMRVLRTVSEAERWLQEELRAEQEGEATVPKGGDDSAPVAGGPRPPRV